MESSILWLLIGLTITEFVLLAVVLLFFRRLKRSESLLDALQQRQQQFVAKLSFSAELEQELVATFEERQKELAQLERKLVQRADELKQLLDRAEKIPPRPQPQDPKQIVLDGYRRGLPLKALAQSSGLSFEEVELVLMQAGSS
jgi:hypothetical protein